MYLQTICNVLSSLKIRKQENMGCSLHDLLSLFKLQSNHEFEGKVIFLS